MSTCMTKPRPSPSSNMYEEPASVLVSAVILEISRSEIVTIVVPMIGNSLYFPVRLTNCPARIDVTRVPPISGTIRNPDSVGLSPLTIWRNTGRYVTEPINAKPTINPTTDVTQTSRVRKSGSGRIGSRALRSTRINAIRPTIATAISPIIRGDDHRSEEHTSELQSHS